MKRHAKSKLHYICVQKNDLILDVRFGILIKDDKQDILSVSCDKLVTCIKSDN